MGNFKKLADPLGLFTKPDTPPVVAQSPLADQAKIDAEAAAAGAQARTARRRSVRASSLLATSGSGDMSQVVTGQPIATGGTKTLTGQ